MLGGPPDPFRKVGQRPWAERGGSRLERALQAGAPGVRSSKASHRETRLRAVFGLKSPPLAKGIGRPVGTAGPDRTTVLRFGIFAFDPARDDPGDEPILWPDPGAEPSFPAANEPAPNGAKAPPDGG